MSAPSVPPAPAGRSAMLLAVLALCAAMICFQLGASVAKTLFPVVGAEGTTTLRQGLGAAMLVLVGRPWRRRLARRGLATLVLYGAALGAMNLLFYLALRTVPLGIAVALEFIGPLGVAAAAIRRPADLGWLALAVAGLALLLPHGQRHGIDPHGAALALGAGACWALYILFGGHAGATHGHDAAIYGAIVAALVAAPFGIGHAGTRLLDAALLPAGLLMAALSSAIPYSLEIIALTRLPARVYGTLTSVEPALGSLVGLVLLHEALTGTQWIGIVAVVVASVGTTAAIGPSRPIAPDAEAGL